MSAGNSLDSSEQHNSHETSDTNNNDEKSSSQDYDNEVKIPPYKLALKNFTSQFFLIPQGMGILSIILHQLNYRFNGLTTISRILWVLTLVLLVFFLALYILRIALFPKEVWKKWKTEIMETASLSCISIAYTTIIQNIALNLLGSWGRGWGIVALVLWWINVVIAVAACILGPYVITRHEAPGIDQVPPGILLPMIAGLTVAAGGGVVCRYGDLDADLQVGVIVVSYLFVGLGLWLSGMVHAVVLARLLDSGAWPKGQNVYTLMIMCGPLGQGAFALLILGQCVERGAFAEYNASTFMSGTGAGVISIASQFLGLLTWGYGVFWWAFASIAILQHLASGPKKALQNWKSSLSSWSLVFPWGVFTNAAIELGTILNSRAFNVVATILTILLVILWLLNVGATAIGLVNGKMLGLHRGWRSAYYVSSAEQDKEEAEQSKKKNNS